MITPLGWLERVPTYKDQQEKLTDRDLVDLRLSRLPAAAGGRRPDLPRQVRAGRRGPGAAHRDDARGRPALQSHLRPRGGLRGQGQGRGEEAGQPQGQAARWSCARSTRSRATPRRSPRARALLEKQGNLSVARPRAPVRLPRGRRAHDPGRARGAADRVLEAARASTGRRCRSPTTTPSRCARTPNR